MHDETARTENRPTEPSPMEPGDPDDALILWMLSLTPTQRLEVAQGFIDSVQALRDAPDPSPNSSAEEDDRA